MVEAEGLRWPLQVRSKKQESRSKKEHPFSRIPVFWLLTIVS